MLINRIEISNFRGFAHTEIVLDPHMNVIVGNNTAGKTSILHAIQIALGEFLRQLTLLPGGQPFTRNFQTSDIRRKYNPISKDFEIAGGNPTITASGQYLPEAGDADEDWKHIKWTRIFKGGRTLSTGSLSTDMRNAVSDLENRRSTPETSRNTVLPVLLAFGADRIDNNYKVISKSKAKESRIEKAYRFALAEQVDFKSAFDWIYRYNKNAKTTADFQHTDIAFKEALTTGARIRDIEIPDGLRELWATVQVTNGRPSRLAYELMSDGFKAMINIVSEIAYRCIMLNGIHGKDAVTKTPGIVLIDEIDLFLHPHWQKHVLADLHAAFPRIQFIVTSHSPFIVQSVDSKNVVSLDGFIADENTSRRGIEEIAVAEMGMDNNSIRSNKYVRQRELADEYFDLINCGETDNSRIDRVKRELDRLELEMHLLNDPAYEAYLKFYRKDI